ncbi:hypothetical protein EJD97_025043 [Solanum chilense]|uniref:Uncharacterized protein n=1 Tax=Solanum chilense TaxID=4083 RepID=A0A6N2ASH3_SOLCI|nr:hypothetical protein EJD97_025043 [Solanum chilense]
MKEGNRKNKNLSSSPKRSRPVNLSGPDSGSGHTRLSPHPSVSVLDGEIITEELGLFKISPKNNPRSFPYSVKQQCWDKAEKVKGRDPDRWRRDPLGNTIFRKLVGCPGCLCATVNRSKGNRTDISEAELIQRSSYCRVSGRDMDLLELSAYGDVRRGEDSGGCKIQ